MPCLNEAKSLPFCISEASAWLRKNGIDGEILIADNGSTDNSRELAESLGARVVTVSEKGYGAALMGGIKAAFGKYVIFADADGSYDFSALDPFMDALRQGYPFVTGDRFSGGIERGAMSLSHKIGVPMLSALGRLRYGVKVRDFHCGLRGVVREAVIALDPKCNGMEFATELIALFAKSGAPIKEVPTPLRCDRREGKSHLRTVRDGFRHLKYIIFQGGRRI